MLNTNILVQKTKDHFTKNKKEYVVGGVCFAAGSILTYFLARPSIGALNVYNIYRGEPSDPNKLDGLNGFKFH